MAVNSSTHQYNWEADREQDRQANHNNHELDTHMMVRNHVVSLRGTMGKEGHAQPFNKPVETNTLEPALSGHTVSRPGKPTFPAKDEPEHLQAAKRERGALSHEEVVKTKAEKR